MEETENGNGNGQIFKYIYSYIRVKSLLSDYLFKATTVQRPPPDKYFIVIVSYETFSGIVYHTSTTICCKDNILLQTNLAVL